MQNKFDPKNTTSTSGAFFITKKVYINGLKVHLQLWDTAGQERFRSMVSSFDVNADHILSRFFLLPPQVPMYYRGSSALLLEPHHESLRFLFPPGANAALLLYDMNITNASTFEDFRSWLEGMPDFIYLVQILIHPSVLELKKNCPPELIIYIVGFKADLHSHRQVTSDLACYHNNHNRDLITTKQI
jgi:GTPase SAR1 family protein